MERPSTAGTSAPVFAVTKNELLATLAPSDFEWLSPSLEPIDLRLGQVLETADCAVDNVYFPSSGIISIVAGPTDHRMEIGIIGREGMSGSSIVLGATRASNDCFVQIGGIGLRLATRDLRRAMSERPSIQAHFLLHVHRLMAQYSETAFAGSAYTILQRLARWLLMSQDRVGGEIELSHEFLSVMLDVRRPGVTVALQEMEGIGAIRNTRRFIKILDRTKLIELAAGSYREPMG